MKAVRRIVLAPLAWLFGAIVAARNFLYDLGILRAARAAVPVICVGNISAGGTGKTPLVEYCARLLSERGARVGILSRGYGRETSGFILVSDGVRIEADVRMAGDEPLQLAENLPGIFVAVDEDRVRGAEKLVRVHGVSVIILDDGFQHRRLARELDIVAITAKELITGDDLLPAGLRREPLSAVRRAGAIVITKCLDSAEYEDARRRLPPGTAAVVCGMRTRLHALRGPAPRETGPIDRLLREKIFAVCGIARPESFLATLEAEGLSVVGSMAFADHHWYDAADVDRIRSAAVASGGTVIVTTQKDERRLRAVDSHDETSGPEIVTVLAGLDPVGNAKSLDSTLLKVAGLNGT